MCQFNKVLSCYTSGQARKSIIMYIYIYVSRHIVVDMIVYIYKVLYTSSTMIPKTNMVTARSMSVRGACVGVETVRTEDQAIPPVAHRGIH